MVRKSLIVVLSVILILNSLVLEVSAEENTTNTVIQDENVVDDPQYGREMGYIDDEFYNSNDIFQFNLFSSSTGFNNTVYTHNSKFNNYTIKNGIDVSKYQGNIDWAKVKSAGVDYAFIRVGYRGYESGSLAQDSMYVTNLQGAITAGIKVGVYVYSQAVSTSEAVEEANFVLSRINGYGITMPVIIDYEYASVYNESTGGYNLGGRLYNAGLSKDSATAVCQAFCSTVAAAGYTPMVYANKDMLENSLNANVLSASYDIWLANYTTQTSYAGDYSFWQYTSCGTVNGITGNADCSFWYDTVGTQTIADGIYTISTALDSNKVLDIAGGSTVDGGNVEIYTSNNTNAQKYQVTYLGDGYYTLSALCSGKVLDVASAGKANGTNVWQYSNNGSSAQKWIIKSTGDGYFNIIATNGKCLDVSGGNTSDGSNVQIWESNGTNAQKFKFTIEGSQTISKGVYTISSALNTNMVLDIAGGSLSDFANVQLYTSNNTDAQKFQVLYLGNGYYSIETLCSGKMLDVAYGCANSGTNVQQYTSNGSTAQKWVIKSTGDGYYNIISGVSGNYLDVNAGVAADTTNIQTYAPNASNAQKFSFTECGEQTLTNGTYIISSALDSNKVLDIREGSTTDGANLQLYDRNGTNAQKYVVTYLGNGYYSLQTVCSGKVLDVACGGMSNGTTVWQYTSNGSAAQKWILKSCGNDYYNIISGVNGKSLDVSGGSTLNGTKIQVWELAQTNAQKFKFEIVP